VQSPTKHKVNVPDPNASPSIELIRFVGDWAKMMMLYLWMIRPSYLDFSPTVFFSLSRPWEFFVITKGAVCDASWVFFYSSRGWLIYLSMLYDTTRQVQSIRCSVMLWWFVYLSIFLSRAFDAVLWKFAVVLREEYIICHHYESSLPFCLHCNDFRAGRLHS